MYIHTLYCQAVCQAVRLSALPASLCRVSTLYLFLSLVCPTAVIEEDLLKDAVRPFPHQVCHRDALKGYHEQNGDTRFVSTPAASDLAQSQKRVFPKAERAVR